MNIVIKSAVTSCIHVGNIHVFSFQGHCQRRVGRYSPRGQRRFHDGFKALLSLTFFPFVEK